MRSCGADEREALLSTMGVFVIPGRATVTRPASSAIAPAPETFPPIREALPVFDPPPRG
ncbi:MAG TPA: hypothetical protein VEO02_05675 [Thermoanaerobaculia bacterium]|nr:hypothetical protein [Thermoanaerobaculia bacterium]